LRQNYKPGIFASAKLVSPAFNETVFREIKNLPKTTKGDDPLVKDKAITKDFEEFIDHAKAPFFSFIFYDAAHSNCDASALDGPFSPYIKTCNRILLGPNTPAEPYVNRYKNALYQDDKLIGRVFQKLKNKHMLENTVIVITGDHGQEFNDNKKGYWGHASNYTPYQVQTPLVVYWPNQAPKLIHHQTSHFDVAPTLLKHLLGVTNPVSDYSVGKELSSSLVQEYLLLSSYIDVGIYESDRITRIFPTGSYRIEDKTASVLPKAKLRVPILQRVLVQTKKFFDIGTYEKRRAHSRS